MTPLKRLNLKTRTHAWAASLALSAGLAGTLVGGPQPLVHAATPSTAALAAQHPAMRQTLSLGSQGHWVDTLQADLALLGYPSVGPMTGNFGSQTQAGVEAFQRENGLPVTGQTNTQTWQDILAGFQLTPYLPHTGDADDPNGSGASTPTGGSGSPSVNTTTTTPTSQDGASADQDGTSSSPTTAPSSGQGTAGTASTTSSGTPKTIDGYPVIAVYHMRATAYGPSLKDNYPYGPVDAFGQPLAAGMIAVDPSVIPLKSRVYVKGYTDSVLPTGGFLGRAMDTGGAIKGNRIDIFLNQNPQIVSNFGIEPVTVYVLG